MDKTKSKHAKERATVCPARARKRMRTRWPVA